MLSWSLVQSVLVLLLGAASGCQPSRESLTAGQIGCPANELTTHSSSSDSGWNQTAESWVAECRGRRFICTEVTTSSADLSWIFSDATDSVDSDVTCREELQADTAPDLRIQAAQTTPASSAPPEAGAGFSFGIDRAAAKKDCEGAGHVWHEDDSAHATCSGAASSLDFAAKTRLSFCGGSLCGVTVSHVPEQGWAKSFTDLDAALTAKYGAASSRDVVVPSVCRANGDFDRCARDGALALKVAWQWPNGQRLRLSLGKAPSGDPPAVQLTYVHPTRKSRMDTSGL